MNTKPVHAVATRACWRALGGEVMIMTDANGQITRLLKDVAGETPAIADLACCVDRLHRAQAAKEALTRVPAGDVRAALEARRRQLEGWPAR